MWVGKFCKVEKEFKLSKDTEDSKKDEEKVGRPHWQQIHVKEVFVKASKTLELTWTHFR